MPDPASNADPMKYALEYETYLASVFYAFTGREANLRKLDNGQYVVEYSAVADAMAVVNDRGGKFIVSQLRLQMNKHSAFGDLSRDEIADMAGNVIKATINPIIVWKQNFEVSSLSELESVGLNLFESVYTFYTSLKLGGLKEFNKATITVAYVQKPEQTGAGAGLY